MNLFTAMASDSDIKLETSPAESYLSAPGEVYSSLFSASAIAPSMPSTPTSIGGVDGTTDNKTRETLTFGHVGDSLEEHADDDGTPTPEKKPTKKRKSWGQVLPEPKTNLPPRKRAKTEDEKEQRRVERVLRNRRAAQSSRERKRLEVEALEQRNKELEMLLLTAQKENLLLYHQLTKIQGKPAVVAGAAPPVTLSQELFSSQDGHAPLLDGAGTLNSFVSSHSPATINPVSLSPSLDPVPDPAGLQIQEDLAAEHQSQPQRTPPPQPQPASSQQAQALPLNPLQQSQAERGAAAATGATAPATSTLGPSPDMTQRPAATLCPDLQCLSAEAPQAWTVPQATAPSAATAFIWQLMLLNLSMVLSAFCRPLTQIALSLTTGSSIPPTRAILNSIIYLVTRPSRRSLARISTSTTSSTPTAQTSRPATTSSPAARAARPSRPFTSLRLKVLRKILTSNPILARPLADATMRLLRSVCSEKPLHVVRVCGQAASATTQPSPSSAGDDLLDAACANPATLPSKEVLLTLLWALRVEAKRIEVSASESAPRLDVEWHRNRQQPPKAAAVSMVSMARKRRHAQSGLQEMDARGGRKHRRLD